MRKIREKCRQQKNQINIRGLFDKSPVTAFKVLSFWNLPRLLVSFNVKTTTETEFKLDKYYGDFALSLILE